MTAQLLKLETAPDLVDQVYRVLLDAISAGALAPGQRITQEELAEQLAVSRQPVMQALRLLKKDGFVQDAPVAKAQTSRRRGLLVAPIDGHWIAQVYQVRGALDGLAVRLAASRNTRIDPVLIRAGREAVRQGDIKAMIDADLTFHCAIYRAAENPLIEQSALVHWHHIRRAMGESLQHHALRQTVWDEHERIAHAIAAGDAEHAEILMHQHSRLASIHLGCSLAGTATPCEAPAQGPIRQLRGTRQPG